MRKYTPGPWVAKWSKYRDGEFIVQTGHPSNRVIATFDDDGDGAGEQSIADAHLIAAAPDLIEALRECEEYFDQRADAEYFTDSAAPRPNEEMKLLMIVREAIKKADLLNTERKR